MTMAETSAIRVGARLLRLSSQKHGLLNAARRQAGGGYSWLSSWSSSAAPQKQRWFSTATASATITAAQETSNHAWDNMSDNTKRLAEQLLLEKKSSDENDWWKHRVALSKAITLAESHQLYRQEQAGWLLTYMLGHSLARQRRDTSFRLGIAGAPGAGKSTFIEALGKYILEKGHRGNLSTCKVDDVWHPHSLAVCCVDPSSIRSGGSILGDKTRMLELSSGKYGPRSFVRPAPSGAGTLGGLSTFTHDAVTLCQVASFDLVIVETVGLGQSEVEVEQTVDMLLLLLPPAGGDDLQGVKKGIVEVADMLLVTKADGHLLKPAKQTAADYMRAMPYVNACGSSDMSMAPMEGWERPQVLLVSSATGDGLDKAWEQVSLFRKQMMETGRLEAKRMRQDKYWMWKNLQYLVRLQLNQEPELQKKAQNLEKQLEHGLLTPRVAAAQLLDFLH